jgi:ABC-type Zn uptake system ZnuABC Zn-binding protein ZnuA
LKLDVTVKIFFTNFLEFVRGKQPANSSMSSKQFTSYEKDLKKLKESFSSEISKRKKR